MAENANELATLRTEIEEKSKLISYTPLEFADVEANFAQLRDQIVHLEGDLTEKSATVGALEAGLVDKTTLMATLEAQVVELNTQKCTLEADLLEKITQLTALESTSAAAAAHAQETIAKFVGKLKELRQDVKAKTTECEGLLEEKEAFQSAMSLRLTALGGSILCYSYVYHIKYMYPVFYDINTPLPTPYIPHFTLSYSPPPPPAPSINMAPSRSRGEMPRPRHMHPAATGRPDNLDLASNGPEPAPSRKRPTTS